MVGLGPLMYGCLPAEWHQINAWRSWFQDMNEACGHLILVGAPERIEEIPPSHLKGTYIPTTVRLPTVMSVRHFLIYHAARETYPKYHLSSTMP